MHLIVGSVLPIIHYLKDKSAVDWQNLTRGEARLLGKQKAYCSAHVFRILSSRNGPSAFVEIMELLWNVVCGFTPHQPRSNCIDGDAVRTKLTGQ